MIPQLGAVIEAAGQAGLMGFIVFIRIGAAVVALPGFGERMIPARVRLCIAVTVTIVVAPAVTDSIIPLASNPVALIYCIATESLAGLSLGLVLRFMIHALEMAGAIAAQSTSLSQLFGTGGEPMPAMSHLFVAGGLALAMTLGLHVRLTEFFILSYDALPPGQFPDSEIILGWAIGNAGRALRLAFSLAAPFVVASLIYNIALGAINRAMPQLMVAFVGAPALTAGGLVLLAIAAPLGLELWAASLGTVLAIPFGAPG